MSTSDQLEQTEVIPTEADGFGADEDLAKLGRTRWGWSFKQVVWVALTALLVSFVVIQFLPTGLSRENPPVIAEPAWDSEQTLALVDRACFDCHSNETRWPWYSYVAPMSWMIAYDVREGRLVLNYSEWSAEAAREHTVEEAVDLVSKDLMPLSYYTILHPEAALSTLEKGQLINGLIATFADPAEALDAQSLGGDEQESTD